MKSEKRKCVIRSSSNNVYFNLAMEEYMVRNYDLSQVDLLLVYSDSPCVVLGKNQNVYKEIHFQVFQDQKLDIARRISGGGTVVHDMGNINFSFITAYDFSMVNKYAGSVGAVSDAINNLGVKTMVNERNAILLPNEHKISGSAQFTCSNGILSHLTLLYNADLEMINLGVKSNSFKVESTSSPSVRSPISNLNNYFVDSQDVFLDKILIQMGYEEVIFLSDIHINAIDQLAKEKYSNKEWIYDRTGQAVISSQKIQIFIEEGKIVNTQPPFKEVYGKRLLKDEIGDSILYRMLAGDAIT